jgi:hypothetical protein
VVALITEDTGFNPSSGCCNGGSGVSLKRFSDLHDVEQFIRPDIHML